MSPGATTILPLGAEHLPEGLWLTVTVVLTDGRTVTVDRATRAERRDGWWTLAREPGAGGPELTLVEATHVSHFHITSHDDTSR